MSRLLGITLALLLAWPAAAQTVFQPTVAGGASTITLGSTVLTLGGTTTTVAGLTLSGGTLSGNTTLPASGQISSAGLIGGGVTPGSWLDVGAALASTPASTTTGVLARFRAVTHQDLTGSGPIAGRTAFSFGVPAFASVSAQTLTSATTVYIAGAPTPGANVTLGTNAAAALVVAAGKSGFGTTTPVSTVHIDQGALGSGVVQAGLTLNSTYAAADAVSTIDFLVNNNRSFPSARIGVPLISGVATPSLGFFVAANDSTLAAERMRITNAGVVASLTFQVGSLTALTLATGETGSLKIAASGTAPGALGAKESWVCGTNAGSVKKIAYAGTSATPVTIIDNVGSGVTGC